MKIGDLVKRKPEWGDWVKHNPWMLSEKDLEIGMIIEADTDLVAVLWQSGFIFEREESLMEVIQ